MDQTLDLYVNDSKIDGIEVIKNNTSFFIDIENVSYLFGNRSFRIMSNIINFDNNDLDCNHQVSQKECDSFVLKLDQVFYEVTIIYIKKILYINIEDIAKISDIDIIYNEFYNYICLNIYKKYSKIKVINLEYVNLEKEFTDYIKVNYYNLENMFNHEQFEMFNKKLTLLGETHATSKSYKVKLDILKKMNSRFLMNIFVEELSYTDAKIINLYLDNGDEVLLNHFMKNSFNTLSYSNDNFNFYKEIFKLNQKLTKNNKIILYGIDVQHNPLKSFEYIRKYIIKKDISTSLKDKIKLILEYEKITDYNDIFNFIDCFKENCETYLNSDGYDTAEINLILENMYQGMIFILNNHDKNIRENFMFSNLSFFLKNNNKNVFGVVGSLHTNLLDIGSIAYRLRKQLGVEKILVINMEFLDSQFNNIPLNEINNIISQINIKELTINEDIIVDLRKIPIISKKLKIDFSDLLIIVKDSKPVKTFLKCEI